MNDARMAAVIRAIEARYPGTRVVVEPWSDPEGDRSLRWWMDVLYVRDNYFDTLRRFATRLAFDLYGKRPIPFVLGLVPIRRTQAYLATRRAERRASGVRSRSRALRRGRPSSHPSTRVRRRAAG